MTHLRNLMVNVRAQNAGVHNKLYRGAEFRSRKPLI